MADKECSSRGEVLKSEWVKFVSESIQTFATHFQEIQNNDEMLELCRNYSRQHPFFTNIVSRLRLEIKTKNETVSKKVHIPDYRSADNSKVKLPTLAKNKHPKISNGSALIELNCSPTQGRYLKAKGQIKAGDVLILERPYAAVLQPGNRETHCAHCFEQLKDNFYSCSDCNQVRYCSVGCQQDAVEAYHKYECSLSPLLEMLEISSHLALRLLLVTGYEKLSDFLEKEASNGECSGSSSSNKIPGCTLEGFYSGDYECVHCLVTNTELQPTAALISYALDAVLITEIAFEQIYRRNIQGSSLKITEEIMGCLLLHHMQQMPCNIHALTAIVSVNEQTGTCSKEQRRIAAGIYPTASLMNHACDPDVIVSFIGCTLVVRATHNIQPGEEIAHCYGPSASRMTREVRQNLLQKQYFFTCNCSACKSDKDLEEQYVYGGLFICPKCASIVKVCRESEENSGKCQNTKCGHVQDFSLCIDIVKDAQKLFTAAITSLEKGQELKCLETLKECLKKRQSVLQRFDKDVGETHDILSRCHASLGDFRQAAFHCEQSTESVRRRFGAESVEYAHELHKLAQLLFNGRQGNQAVPVIENGIRLLSIHYGSQYSDVEELQKMRKTLRNFIKGKT